MVRKSIREAINKVIKNLIVIGIAVILLFSLVACGNVTMKFDSLEEMQAALPDYFYYFVLDNEVFGEPQKFSAIKYTQSTENGQPLYRYMIWYDVRGIYEDQNYQFIVVGTPARHPGTAGRDFRNTTGVSFTIDEYQYSFHLKWGETSPSDETKEYFRNKAESIVETKYKP